MEEFSSCCTVPSERVMEYSSCHNLIISFTLLCQFQYKPNFHVCLFFINFCKFPLVCGGELMIVEWKHGTNGGWKIINVAPVYKYWISLKYFWFWKPGINKINLNVFRCWVMFVCWAAPTLITLLLSLDWEQPRCCERRDGGVNVWNVCVFVMGFTCSPFSSIPSWSKTQHRWLWR